MDLLELSNNAPRHYLVELPATHQASNQYDLAVHSLQHLYCKDHYLMKHLSRQALILNYLHHTIDCLWNPRWMANLAVR